MRRAGTAAKAAACALSLLLVACGVPGMSGCIDGGSRSISGDCTLITVPADVPQKGVYTVTCYDDFAGRWASGTQQEAVCSQWQDAGSEWDDGIAVIDGLYLVACSETFGSVGDKVVWVLEDGTEIPSIIADAKSSGDANYTKWGHMTGGTVNVIEFEVKRSVYMQRGNPGSSAWKGEWGGKAVNSCRNYGTGGKADGDGLGGCSSSAVGGDGYLTTAMQVAEDDSHGYRTGSMGPDEFDCQGFVKWCLKQNGWDISPWGFKDGTGTGAAAEGLSKMGWDVAPYDAEEIQPGDILIYHYSQSNGHVAFYAGDGNVVDSVGDFDGAPGDSSGTEIARRPNSYTKWQYRARPPAGTSTGSAGSSSGGAFGCSALLR